MRKPGYWDVMRAMDAKAADYFDETVRQLATLKGRLAAAGLAAAYTDLLLDAGICWLGEKICEWMRRARVLSQELQLERARCAWLASQNPAVCEELARVALEGVELRQVVDRLMGQKPRSAGTEEAVVQVIEHAQGDPGQEFIGIVMRRFRPAEKLDPTAISHLEKIARGFGRLRAGAAVASVIEVLERSVQEVGDRLCEWQGRAVELAKMLERERGRSAWLIASQHSDVSRDEVDRRMGVEPDSAGRERAIVSMLDWLSGRP